MRPLTILAAAVAALALLAGCGGGDEPTSSTTTTSSTSAATTGPTGPEDPAPPAGAGGDDGGEREGGQGTGPSVGNDPESALDAYFTSGDPDIACDQVVTEALVTANYGDAKGCRQAQVPGAVAASIEVTELEVDGDSAEAVVVPKGGPNDGFEHRVELVNVGGAWALDSLEADIPAGP